MQFSAVILLLQEQSMTACYRQQTRSALLGICALLLTADVANAGGSSEKWTCKSDEGDDRFELSLTEIEEDPDAEQGGGLFSVAPSGKPMKAKYAIQSLVENKAGRGTAYKRLPAGSDVLILGKLRQRVWHVPLSNDLFLFMLPDTGRYIFYRNSTLRTVPGSCVMS